MPRYSDPAPCDKDEQLFECADCGTRLCSEKSSVVCGCGATMRNLSVPRAE